MFKTRPLIYSLLAVLALAQCDLVSSSQERSAGVQRSLDGATILNMARARHGRNALAPNAVLDRVAARHVRDMEANNFIGHVSSNGDRLRNRAEREGYRSCWIGENAGFGQGSPDEIMRDWMASPAHRRILLHRRAVEFGLARGPQDAWVLVVAEPGCR